MRTRATTAIGMSTGMASALMPPSDCSARSAVIPGNWAMYDAHGRIGIVTSSTIPVATTAFHSPSRTGIGTA